MTAREASKPRERLLDAASTLFAADGISRVGIDAILAKSGCAKASLYHNFGSKLGLAIAVLERREALWTHAWLEADLMRRTCAPEERLLAIFDALDGWFRMKTFAGCIFVKALLESNAESPIHRAAAIHLANIRVIVRRLADEANLSEPESFAQCWHMLMKGAIVAANEGNRNAARDAKRAARLVIANWERRGRS